MRSFSIFVFAVIPDSIRYPGDYGLRITWIPDLVSLARNDGEPTLALMGLRGLGAKIK
jgi:hypothetical protein